MKINFFKAQLSAVKAENAAVRAEQQVTEFAQSARGFSAENDLLKSKLKEQDDAMDTLILGQLGYTYIIELGKLALGDHFDPNDPPTSWFDLTEMYIITKQNNLNKFVSP